MTKQDPTNSPDATRSDEAGTEPHPAAPASPTWTQRLLRLPLTTLGLYVILATLILLAGLPVLVFLDQFHDRIHGAAAPAVVLSVQAVGMVSTVRLSEGWLARSLVETDVGFYVLERGLSLDKHQPLTVERRADAARYLCDPQHRCARVL